MSAAARETDHARKKRRNAERDALIAQRGNHCEICGKPPKTLALNVDHDHKTGKVRGLLCIPCNRRLPRGITPEWLRAAAAYLERTAELAWCDYCGQPAPRGERACAAHADLPEKESL